MRINMQPIIKWPGGKSKEIIHVQSIMPDKYDRYFEPFFGGGAVFFKLRPPKALINDLSDELITFYRFVKGELPRKEFQKEMLLYAACWESIPKLIASLEDDLLKLFYEFRLGKKNSAMLKKYVQSLLQYKTNYLYNLFPEEVIINNENLLEQIRQNIVSKLMRIKALELKKHLLPLEDLKSNIETSFRSGFYMHFRDLMNLSKLGKIELSKAKQTANYYFVREFCYGAMFRFNSHGAFNIPYGGIAYNRKDFRKKVEAVFSEEVFKLFSGAIIENMDFTDFLEKHPPVSNDFIFLDPPYDSDFSEYAQNAFTKSDQERLARILLKLKTRFVLIIKNTDFIVNLYQNQPGIILRTFDKTYLYNVRGRNDRETEHLLIYNYK